MYGRLMAWALIGGVLAVRPAAAQDSPRWTGLVWGAQITGTISRADGAGFFNYTSYEEDTLRLVRARVMGEWRLPGRVDVLVEARTENTTGHLPAAFLRWQVVSAAPLYVQAGRLPPIVGAFAQRAYGADNLLAGLPLVYQYLTSLRPDAQPATADDLLRMRGRGWLASFPVGATNAAAGLALVGLDEGAVGVQGVWQPAGWSVAAGLTRGSSADPRFREHNSGWTISARAARAAASGLTVGLSGARGAWVDRGIPAVSGAGRSQTLAGVDVEFARGRWVVRAEAWRASFDLPTLATTVTARAGFVEGRFRWRPRWQVSVRGDAVGFSQLQGASRTLAWDAPVRRVEVVVGFRAARRIELRAGWQHNWRDGGRVRERGFPVAQGLVWF